MFWVGVGEPDTSPNLVFDSTEPTQDGPIDASRHNCDHKTAEKEPLVNRSASWSFVLTYCINIPGSLCIVSKSQSRLTLCVRWTCLIFGDRRLIVIFITASLSSRTITYALEPGDLTVKGT